MGWRGAGVVCDVESLEQRSEVAQIPELDVVKLVG